MTTRELAELVKKMRDAQRDYFRTRDRHDLRDAQGLERQVDKEVQAVITGQDQSLFETKEIPVPPSKNHPSSRTLR